MNLKYGAEEDFIDRSATHVDYNDYIRLFRLTVKNEWLETASKELIELWNLCDTKNQQKLLEELLDRFHYVNSALLKEYSDQIASHILNVWKCSPKNTRIVASSNCLQSDGSQFFLHSLKMNFTGVKGWTQNHFLNRLRDSIKKGKNGFTLIILDDFIGSGNKIKGIIDYVQKEAKKIGKEFYLKVCCIGAMEFSQKYLKKLKSDFYSAVWLKKGISDFYSGKLLALNNKYMKLLEKKLHHIYNGKYLNSFGYKKSETLFSIEPFNVPNNVFPIFWWPVLKGLVPRKPLFKRFR